MIKLDHASSLHCDSDELVHCLQRHLFISVTLTLSFLLLVLLNCYCWRQQNAVGLIVCVSTFELLQLSWTSPFVCSLHGACISVTLQILNKNLSSPIFFFSQSQDPNQLCLKSDFFFSWVPFPSVMCNIINVMKIHISKLLNRQTIQRTAKAKGVPDSYTFSSHFLFR